MDSPITMLLRVRHRRRPPRPWRLRIRDVARRLDAHRLSLRGERDPARQAHLLELSGLSVGLMYIGLGVLLLAGILAAFMGGLWDRGWIWASLAILVVVIAVMYAVATPFYGRMRAAAGVPGTEQLATRFKPPATPADLDALATSNRPFVLAAVGGIGLVLIVWLMLSKPL